MRQTCSVEALIFIAIEDSSGTVTRLAILLYIDAQFNLLMESRAVRPTALGFGSLTFNERNDLVGFTDGEAFFCSAWPVNLDRVDRDGVS